MTDKLDELILEINKTQLPKETKQLLIDKGRELKRVRTLNNPTFCITDTYGYKPNEIVVGDIVLTLPNGLAHPSLVFKINKKKGICYALPITNNELFLGNFTKVQNNRFITGFVTCSPQVLTLDEALRYWKCNLGKTTELNRIVRELKLFYKKLLNM